MSIKTLPLLISSLLLLLSCSQEANTTATETPAPVALANPASTKCTADGFQLIERAAVNGVGSEFVCFNPKNKKQCGQWVYFRGECSLE
ncbi:MAG: hypothetical protein methR_P0318 [Methyloprofundus sp.]|nr:MAG: hypothetical protein methR_P0318 [Methyloprofundus sp.]